MPYQLARCGNECGSETKETILLRLLEMKFTLYDPGAAREF
jgi:hypothetical protein